MDKDLEKLLNDCYDHLNEAMIAYGDVDKTDYHIRRAILLLLNVHGVKKNSRKREPASTMRGNG